MYDDDTQKADFHFFGNKNGRFIPPDNAKISKGGELSLHSFSKYL